MSIKWKLGWRGIVSRRGVDKEGSMDVFIIDVFEGERIFRGILK